MTAPSAVPVLRRTRTRVVAAVVTVALLLVGQHLWQQHQARQPVTDPARAGVPAVHWPNGHGTGRWDHDPWVQTLREALTLLAVAANTGDFTDPALRTIVSQDYLESYAQSRAELRSTTYQPGPWPFAVRDLETTETSATVHTCRTGHWTISDPGYVPTPEAVTTGRGHRVVWELAMRPDGSRYVTSATNVPRPYDLCPAPGIVVGYFDPPPPYGQQRGPVIGPDGQVRQPTYPYDTPQPTSTQAPEPVEQTARDGR
ncbi:hypothetical protein [Cellulomonas sp. IC4_254]|uniref:hypothetical protein n=1 Tax=Cellulomonas sp. IC4_254 TaxID=2714040 RepID=UPI00142456D0|nr:hypothetical protein [Cellulomonas sp. IC4_254]NHT18838.1 hypothetical protein [Cellulomonas sp. IC4_254]